MPGSDEALLGARARPESTVTRSTTRLDPSARAELSSTTVMFKQFAPRRGAGDTTQARVDGFAWDKKPFGIILLETSITSVLATRSQDQRIGRREDGPGAPARERERAFVQVECGVGALELH